MNMPANHSTNTHQESNNFIAEAVFAVETIKCQQTQEKQIRTKLLMDAIFPLDQGSHKDATSYMVDGRHLMIYFKNGEHTGLKESGRFVAFTGHRAHPDSVLLRDKEGCYVEILFERGTNEGTQSFVDIADIQLETCAKFNHSAVRGIRHWVSLIKTDEHGQPKASLDEKEFTAKNGEDYILSPCF